MLEFAVPLSGLTHRKFAAPFALPLPVSKCRHSSFVGVDIAWPPRGLLDRLFVSLVRRCWQVPVGNVGTVESYRCKVEAAGSCEVEIESIGDRTIPGYFRSTSFYDPPS